MAKKTDLLGYCGMYCPQCPSYTHEVADLAKNLRSRLRHYKFDRFAPAMAKVPAFEAFEYYDKGFDLLGAISKMRCKGPCRAGGGGTGCKIRKCAKKKRLDGCWQCDVFAKCHKLEMLKEFGDTSKSYLTNLRKLKRIGPADFVKQKAADLS
jgi:hypothetical protein